MACLSAALSARVFWQLPTYDGTKSYQNLLVEVYEMITGILEGNHDATAQISPVNFVRSGLYGYSSGGISARSSNGNYWQSRVYSETYARDLSFYSTYLYPQYNYNKGYGFSVRCLVSLEQLPTYDGTKSYQNLLVEVYGMQESTNALTTTNSDSPVQFSPTDFIRNGYYHNSGTLNSRKDYGLYWQFVAASYIGGGDLFFKTNLLFVRDNSTKGFGLSIRCPVR